MLTSVRSTHFFDTRSVLLFAALTMGAGVALHARATDIAPATAVLGPHAQPTPPAAENSANRPVAKAQKNTAPPMTESPAFGAATNAGATGDAKNSKQRLEINAAMPTAARSAFDRADINRDGQLSAKEAQMLPAISERFQQIDTNHDGMLSRGEFAVGSAS